ncbi:uncharacterized protein M437DRAFT_73617 [Aureobasidium melanogenum CBS 110374]|uniref:Uncharacterized protein n=1 Tax=Aureobasidium melanogenum (strain CBS 110374) TaxID=1043003 RepID=A0A074W462_AURM1|nr:uncharacterized protein M437DRAFT_73617 [Aureobasidium melanogenum CBS 110374]KEQ64687.1 hypothetical protein M437DRAFT_73617 [Aureobasidium melanogenum CBS 110374]
MELNDPRLHPNKCPHHRLVDVNPTEWKGMVLALRETNMILVMQRLMEKPEWYRKIFDDTICDKWMAEVVSQVEDFSELMWQYCVAELRDKAKTMEETGVVAPIDVDVQVVYSDTTVPEDLRRDLDRAVASLENVPTKDKDWHPRTRERVLDLVHPSLFPLIYGRSKVLREGVVELENCTSYCGQGAVIERPESTSNTSTYHSLQFQWLPCDVHFQGEDDVKIPFTPRLVPEEPPLDLRREYADSGLQIIVKLANTYLTPNDPQWDGGSWHVEGLSNEHIIATAIYYFSNDNITPSHLKFRHNCSDEAHLDLEYDQGDWDHLEKITGFKDQTDALIQKLGSVLCKEGRLLAFPNVLQHNVGSFQLEDDTRGGERKILALFLVDPHVRILSTSKVPPQRKDWWQSELRKQREDIHRLKTLPNELMEQVFGDVMDFPISMDEAKNVREALMEERGPISEDMIECEASFYFCEH